MDRTALDALLLYDEVERADFAAQRWPAGRPPDTQLPREGGFAPPRRPRADYEAGAVSVRWELDPATGTAVRELLPDQQLAHRVYRSDGAEASRLVATLGLDVTRWRDDAMPLTGAELAYEVWTVLLKTPTDGGEPTLVRAESSELVTVTVPEHFRLVLVSGDSVQAVIRVEIGPRSAPVAAHTLELQTGDTVDAGDLGTGLVLTELQVVDVERLTSRSHLVFTSDARLVLDPVTHAPRTTETQVLMPVKRLIATLSGPSGATRTLEMDLP